MSMPSIRISIDEIVHPIEATQQRGLPAAGRSDEGGDRSLGNAQINVMQHLMLAILEIEMLDLDHALLDLRFLNRLRLVDDEL